MLINANALSIPLANKSGDTKGSYEYFKQLRKGAK